MGSPFEFLLWPLTRLGRAAFGHRSYVGHIDAYLRDGHADLLRQFGLTLGIDLSAGIVDAAGNVYRLADVFAQAADAAQAIELAVGGAQHEEIVGAYQAAGKMLQRGIIGIAIDHYRRLR